MTVIVAGNGGGVAVPFKQALTFAVRSRIAARKQKLAPDLNPLLAVILNNISSRVGLAPALRQKTARPHAVQRHIRKRNRLALLRTETRTRRDLHLVKTRAVQSVTQMPDRRRRHAGANQKLLLLRRQIPAQRLRRAALQNLIRLRRRQTLNVTTARHINANRKTSLRRALVKVRRHRKRVRHLARVIINKNRDVLVMPLLLIAHRRLKR